MKKFFCLLTLSLFLIPMSAAAAHKGRTWGLKPVVLQLLPYGALLDLPDDKRAAYIEELRAFNAKQELKWYGQDVTADTNVLDFMKYFTLIDQAEAQNQAAAPASSNVVITGAGNLAYTAPDKCDLGNLPASFQGYVANGHDRCEIGGYLVCMVHTNVGGVDHLRCNATDPAFKKFALEVCKKDGMVPCAVPLYADDKTGNPVCVPVAGGPISPKCQNASKIDLLAQNMKTHPAYKQYYDSYKKNVEAYCTGANGGKPHKFDEGDCAELQNRLSKVASVYDTLVKDDHICNVQSTLYRGVKNTNPVSIQVALDIKMDGGKPTYHIVKQGQSEGWIQTQCGPDGRVKNPTNIPWEKGYFGNSWETCLAKNANGTTQVLRFGQQVPPCQLHYQVYNGTTQFDVTGITGKEGLQCDVSLGTTTFSKYKDGADFKGLQVSYLREQDTNSMGVTSPQGLTLVPKSNPAMYSTTGKDDDGSTALIYDPNAKDTSSKCWATYQQNLAVDKDYMAPNAAAPAAPTTAKQK